MEGKAMMRVLGAVAAGVLIAAPAAAGEVVATAGASGPAVPSSTAVPAPSLGDPAVQPPGVDVRAPEDARCRTPSAPDGKPHGQVWGGVGTHGYREAGGAVTLPAGKCSSVSIAVDSVQGGFGGWRR